MSKCKFLLLLEKLLRPLEELTQQEESTFLEKLNGMGKMMPE